MKEVPAVSRKQSPEPHGLPSHGSFAAALVKKSKTIKKRHSTIQTFVTKCISLGKKGTRTIYKTK